MVPSYRRHKPSGQAVVTINGRDIYLGRWNTKASRAEYDRLISEWLAGGRSLPPDDRNGLTVSELALRYWKFAKQYYRRNGQSTGTAENLRPTLRLLRTIYGDTRAADFGPLALKALRQKMIEQGQSRRYVNDNVARIKQAFRWAVKVGGNVPGRNAAF